MQNAQKEKFVCVCLCVYVCVRHRDDSNECQCKIDITVEEITHRIDSKHQRLEDILYQQ